MGTQSITFWRNKLFQVTLNETHRRFMLWMLGGLLLRLLIIPFFCHADFLSEYRRVHMTINTGYFFPGLGRLVVYYIELLFMTLSLPFLPSADVLFYFSDMKQSTAGLPAYFLFVNDPSVFRTLFLLKMPYLLFDLGTAALIFRMFAGRHQQFQALKLWLFNPVTLYVFYVFGRFESIPIFFLALSLQMIQKERFFVAAFTLGLAINCREVNIVFVPVFILGLIDFRSSWMKNAARLLPAAAIVGGWMVLPKIISSFLYLTPLFNSDTVLETNRAGHLFDFRHDWLLPFVFSYSVICLWLLENRQNCFYRIVTSWGLCMIAFFFFTRHSAHYVSWLVLFPVMMLYFDMDMIKPFVLLCCSWFGLWLLATDAGVFTLLLASPLSIKFSGWPTLPQWYAQIVGTRTVFNLGTAILILNNLYHVCLAYLCYKFFAKPHI